MERAEGKTLLDTFLSCGPLGISSSLFPSPSKLDPARVLTLTSWELGIREKKHHLTWARDVIWCQTFPFFFLHLKRSLACSPDFSSRESQSHDIDIEETIPILFPHSELGVGKKYLTHL